MSRNVKELFDLTGRTALITGGSRGLGLQMAEALGEAGARVLLSSRKAGDLEQAVKHLRGRGITADFIAADASKDADMHRLADDAIERLGRVDILVNNAGASWGAPAEEYPIEAWDKVMNLNIRGIFLLTQRIGAKSMLPAKRGRIINIASIAGLGGNAAFLKTIAYNTSKGACITFTQALAAEWGPSRHHASTRSRRVPFRDQDEREGMFAARGRRQARPTKAPLRRTGDDEDLKGLVLLLASDAGKHITGQVVAVDGGISSVLAA